MLQPVKQQGPKAQGTTPLATAAVGRKLADSSPSSAPLTNRKPGLGKGVPPPVPPNKPVVPVKKELGGGGKRTAVGEMKDITLSLVGGEGGGKQSSAAVQNAAPSMVTGLQGLKFGISIGSVVDGGAGTAGKGIKPLGGGGSGSGDVSTKKFFNNIESKS